MASQIKATSEHQKSVSSPTTVTMTSKASPTSPETTDIAKKRTRTRRRTNNKTTMSPANSPQLRIVDSAWATSGNVSESSSEQSKRSLQRKHAAKKSKQPSSSSSSVSVEVPLTAQQQSQYLAMDCEMVGVGVDGSRSTLARVTIVNWDNEIVLDQFVRPSEPVTDYRTFVSGITAADLQEDNDDNTNNKCVTLEQCRATVLSLICDKTLVGHALKNDLAVLKIQHPWQCTRDTAKYEPFMKQRFDDGILWPRKLKDLVWEHLQNKEIQRVGHPHSAWEDAVAAFDLYKSARVKWEKVMDYKIRKTAEITLQKQSKLTMTPPADANFVDQAWPALEPMVAVS